MLRPGIRLCDAGVVEAVAPPGWGAPGLGTPVRLRLDDGRSAVATVLDSTLVPHGAEVSRFLLAMHEFRAVGHPNLVPREVVDRDDRFVVVGGAPPEGTVPLPCLGPNVPSVYGILALGVSRALATLHHRDRVHGWLHPGCVFVGAGTCCVAQYGIAPQVDRRALVSAVLDDPSVVVAPEVLDAGEPLGPASDVFGFGLVMAAACAHGASMPATVARLRAGGMPELPAPLAEVVAACLHVDPRKRPANGAELLAKVEAVLSTMEMRSSGTSLSLARAELAGISGVGPAVSQANAVVLDPSASESDGAMELSTEDLIPAEGTAGGVSVDTSVRTPDGGSALEDALPMSAPVRSASGVGPEVRDPTGSGAEQRGAVGAEPPPVVPGLRAERAEPSPLLEPRAPPPKAQPMPERGDPGRRSPVLGRILAVALLLAGSGSVLAATVAAAKVGVFHDWMYEVRRLFGRSAHPDEGRGTQVTERSARDGGAAAAAGKTAGDGASSVPEATGSAAGAAGGLQGGLRGESDAPGPGGPKNERGGAAPGPSGREGEGGDVPVCPAGTVAVLAGVCIERAEHPGLGRIPTVGVTHRQAAVLCEERGGRLCRRREWEAACAGPHGWAYPYGPQMTRDACNTASIAGYPQEVGVAGSWSACRTPRGVFDLVGNVGEWVAEGIAVGGDSTTDAAVAGCFASGRPPPGYAGPELGFRCCYDVAGVVPADVRPP